MGVEGAAGRSYFQCIAQVMPQKYAFNGRSWQPVKDPFNAVLN
jgi:CRISP-associated protein Cas1